MQLSLIDEIPEFSKKYFLDIYAEAVYDSSRHKMRLLTIEGQTIPRKLKISCPNQILARYPEGTIYKLDTRLVRKEGQTPYFIAINQKGVQRAIEYFDYNLKVQNGFDYLVPGSRK